MKTMCILKYFIYIQTFGTTIKNLRGTMLKSTTMQPRQLLNPTSAQAKSKLSDLYKIKYF